MYFRKLILAAIVLMAFTSVPGQQTTEKFIPIGMSPGVSNQSSYQGEVVAVDAATNTFSMQVDGMTKSITVVPTTRIWLDRSKSRQTNLDGSFDDLKAGRRVEVLRQSGEETKAAWIKIETS